MTNSIFTFKVSDGVLTSAEHSFTLVPLNTAPIAESIQSQEVDENSIFNFQLPSTTFSDVEDDTLSVVATLSDGSSLPAWLIFDASSWTFYGVPSQADIGVVSILVTATDSDQASVSSSFTVTVRDVNYAPTSGDVEETMLEDDTYVFTAADFPFEDFDGDVPAFVVISSLPTSGRLLFNGVEVVAGAEIPLAQISNLIFTMAPPPPPPPPPPPGPESESGVKYRNQSEQLFQPIPRSEEPNPLPDGAPFSWKSYGATATYVDRTSGWRWNNVGGDWIDYATVPQGPTPWASTTLNAVIGTSNSYVYSVNITDAVNYVHDTDTWMALHLSTTGGIRHVASAKNETPPRIDVVYEDGEVATLDSIYSAPMSSGSVNSGSAGLSTQMPIVAEFKKPTKRVQSATLTILVTAHYSGSSVLKVNVVNPPINTLPVSYGISENYGVLDEGLTSDVNILGTHRYLDGSTREEFISTCGLTISAERDYDPAIWDNGPTDLNKLPHRDLGKFIAAGDSFSLITSEYQGEGFAPLTPGLGAMKVVMPKDDRSFPGAVTGSGGSAGSIAKIFLPEPLFGRLKKMHVRYYLRFGTQLDNSFSNMWPTYTSAGTAPLWTDMGGKTGITPSHATTYGGYSGSSGGGYGWQMRLAWSDQLLDIGGPNAGGTGMAIHTYDFLTNNPPGHRYGDGSKPDSFGDIGGHGGIFYPGHWYCIEQEVDLNTVTPEAPGYLADGAVRIWVDGVLSLNMESMVMRTLPLITRAYQTSAIRPCRELGIRDLTFNWFHGGKTLNTIDRSIFVTGLAWGTEYIGPMKLE